MTRMPTPQNDVRYAPPRFGNGMGTTGLVIGVAGLLLVWVPGLGILLGPLGLTFSAVGYGNVRRGTATNRGVSIAGLILGIVNPIASVAFVVILMRVLCGDSTESICVF